jgi:putative transposase
MGKAKRAHLKNQVYLGSEGFVERMQARIAPDPPIQEIPRTQRRPVPKPLAYFSEHYPERDDAIAEAYRTGAYSMHQIAEHFGVGRMTVNRAVKRYETSRSV